MGPFSFITDLKRRRRSNPLHLTTVNQPPPAMTAGHDSVYRLGDPHRQVSQGAPDAVKEDQVSSALPHLDHAATTTNGTAHQLASPQTSSQARPAPTAVTHPPPRHPDRPPSPPPWLLRPGRKRSITTTTAQRPPFRSPTSSGIPVQPSSSTSDGDITDVYSHPAALAYVTSHPRRKIPLMGPYLLLQTLYEGEDSKVKLGLHSERGEEVAVKLIRLGTVDHTARMSRTEREIEVLRVRRPETSLSIGFEIANILLVSS